MLAATERKTSMTHDPLAPRPVRDSQSEMAEIVLPNDANPLAALLGGRLMHWIDLAGAMAAHRHSRNYVVTASVDHIDFLVPVRVGDLVILRSSVNRVFHTSMEVGVKVFVENYIADTAQHVASAYLTFVAIDPVGKHLKVAPVIPETDEQQRRNDDTYHQAARFWARIFGINFVLGVVTGIPMEFQFGTNWSHFSRFAGGVIGQTLAMEGMFAFFLESTFLGLFLYGEKRLSPRAHWWSAVAV